MKTAVATEEFDEKRDSGEGEKSIPAYDRAIAQRHSELKEADSSYQGGSGAKPGSLLRKISERDSHIRERLEAKTSVMRNMVYQTKKHFVKAVDSTLGIDGSKYESDLEELMVNQGALLDELIGVTKQARRDMKRSYAEIDGYRNKLGSDLGANLEQRSGLERRLGELGEEQEGIQKQLQADTETEADKSYAEALLRNGSINLEREAIVNAIQGLNQRIKYGRENLKEAEEQQKGVLAIINEHNRQVNNLYYTRDQLSIAYAVMTGAVAEEESLKDAAAMSDAMANTIMWTLNAANAAIIQAQGIATRIDTSTNYIAEQIAGMKRPQPRGKELERIAAQEQEYVRNLRKRTGGQIQVTGGAARYIPED